MMSPTWTPVVAAMQTQAGADAMEHDGIIPETLVILVGR